MYSQMMQLIIYLHAYVLETCAYQHTYAPTCYTNVISRSQVLTGYNAWFSKVRFYCFNHIPYLHTYVCMFPCAQEHEVLIRQGGV